MDVHLGTGVAGSFWPPACHLILLTTLLASDSRSIMVWCSWRGAVACGADQFFPEWGLSVSQNTSQFRSPSTGCPLHPTVTAATRLYPLGASQHSVSPGSDKVVSRVGPTSMMLATLLAFSQTCFLVCKSGRVIPASPGHWPRSW